MLILSMFVFCFYNDYLKLAKSTFENKRIIKNSFSSVCDL